MLQSLNSASTPIQVPAANGAGSQIPALERQAFLKLLTPQLQYQNSFSPADPGDTVQQLVALTQVSTLQEISRLLRQFLGKGASYNPASWLGRSALVTSSHALPQTDGSYAGEFRYTSPCRWISCFLTQMVWLFTPSTTTWSLKEQSF